MAKNKRPHQGNTPRTSRDSITPEGACLETDLRDYLTNFSNLVAQRLKTAMKTRVDLSNPEAAAASLRWLEELSDRVNELERIRSALELLFTSKPAPSAGKLPEEQ
jgi:hypothetical protein